MMTPYNVDLSIFPRGISIQRGTDGRILDTSLDAIYRDLVANKRLTSTSDLVANLNSVQNASRSQIQTALSTDAMANESTTLTNLKTEFCYSYRRYEETLNTLFDTLASASVANTLTDAQKNTINTSILNAGTLNGKLNDLIQITNYITTKKAADTTQANQAINSLNSTISSTFNVLQDHKRILNSQNAVGELRKRMAEYSTEKNKSASNLLGLYGFLNLVALGLLFYVYRTE